MTFSALCYAHVNFVSYFWHKSPAKPRKKRHFETDDLCDNQLAFIPRNGVLSDQEMDYPASSFLRYLGPGGLRGMVS